MREILIAIALGAGERIMQRYQQPLDKEMKIGDDFVTIADKESDTYIREQLTLHFPDDQILSEETALLPSGRWWHVRVVDPLDATKMFATGSDRFAVLIGRCTDGIPDLGISYFPAKREIYYAEAGKGAYKIDADWHEQRLYSRSGITRIEDAIVEWPSVRIPFVSYHDHIQRDDYTLTNTHNGRSHTCQPTLSCSALSITNIASGLSDAKMHLYGSLAKRDTCAGHALIREAGWDITAIDGSPLDYTQESSFREQWCIVSSDGLKDDLCNFLKKE